MMKALIKNKKNGRELDYREFFYYFEGMKLPPDYREYTNKKTGNPDPIIDWGEGRIAHKSTLEKKGYTVEVINAIP